MKKGIGLALMLLPAVAGWVAAATIYSNPYAPIAGAIVGMLIYGAAAGGALLYADAATEDDYAG